jgi:hypothetical protein
VFLILQSEFYDEHPHFSHACNYLIASVQTSGVSCGVHLALTPWTHNKLKQVQNIKLNLLVLAFSIGMGFCANFFSTIWFVCDENTIVDGYIGAK